MPSPNFKLNNLLSIVISALPSMICIKVSKGDNFSGNSSPSSNEDKVTLPVIRFSIVLLTTALGTY